MTFYLAITKIIYTFAIITYKIQPIEKHYSESI